MLTLLIFICRDQYKWIQNNFLNADRVNRWLQGILSKVFEKAGASGTWISVEDKYHVSGFLNIHDAILCVCVLCT